MLKRVTTTCMVLCLLLPALFASASAHSILWAATNDCTCLVKDEEYAAAPALMTAVPGLDDDASLLVEETDGGLVILYEEPDPKELIGVEETVPSELDSVVDETVPPDLIIVEDEAEEIELEETINDQIREP